MKSDLPKGAAPLGGRTLLDHVLGAVRAAGVPRTVVVVGHEAELVEESCRAPDVAFALQRPQLGTGHAVQVAVPALAGDGWTLVLAGDVPCCALATLRRLVAATVDARRAPRC